MSVFRVKHAYNFQGQGMVNVYHYLESVAGVGTAENLAKAFQDLVLPKVLAGQASSCETVYVSAENLSVISNDSYLLSYVNTFGQRPDAPMPPHDAMSFQLLVETNNTRMGSKRVGGLCETDFTGGIAFGNAITYTNNMADAFSMVLESLLGIDFWIPVVYRKTGILPFVANVISGARFNQVTTQNSRKWYTSSVLPTSTSGANLVITGDVNGLPPSQGVGKAGKPWDIISYPNTSPAVLFDDGSNSPSTLPLVN